MSNNKGFTIIELMIASLIFSVLLLLLTFGILQISRVFYKGITTTKTQETSRNLISNITKTIQFNGGTVTFGPGRGDNGPYYFCVNDTRYTYYINTQLKPGVADHVFVRDRSSTCSGPANISLSNWSSLDSPVELMQANMRLANTSDGATQPVISQNPDNSYKVHVKILYGDNAVVESGPSPQKCDGSIQQSQFCAVSDLTTNVNKRI